MDLSLSHRRQVGRLSVFYHLLSGPTPSAWNMLCPPSPFWVTAGCTWSTNNLLLVKLPKSTITAHLSSFVPPFSHLWNKSPHSLQSHPSFQVFKTAVHQPHPKAFTVFLSWEFAPVSILSTPCITSYISFLPAPLVCPSLHILVLGPAVGVSPISFCC